MSAVIIIRIKRIFAYLMERKAFSPNAAVPLSEIPYCEKWYFRRLIEKEQIKMVDGKCYMDEDTPRRYMKKIRMRGIVFCGAALLLYSLYVLLSR